MESRYILTDYLAEAMRQAKYEELEDGSFGGTISECPGVIAFGASLHACEEELRSTLEDWVLVGLKLAHPIPILAGIDLNAEVKAA